MNDKMAIMPDKWLYKIKQIWPRICWAELVIWNLRYREISDILNPEENGMMVGGCRKEVEKYSHGWCGHCVKGGNNGL